LWLWLITEVVKGLFQLIIERSNAFYGFREATQLAAAKNQLSDEVLCEKFVGNSLRDLRLADYVFQLPFICLNLVEQGNRRADFLQKEEAYSVEVQKEVAVSTYDMLVIVHQALKRFSL
jgi:hypothetical protein